MEESSLPSTTFVLDENGLIQTNGDETILSETVIDQCSTESLEDSADTASSSGAIFSHFQGSQTQVSSDQSQQLHENGDIDGASTITIQHDGGHSIDISTTEDNSTCRMHQQSHPTIKTRTFKGRGKFPVTMMQSPIKLSSGNSLLTRIAGNGGKINKITMPYTLTRVRDGNSNQKPSFKVMKNNISSNDNISNNKTGNDAETQRHLNIGSPEAITINIAEAAATNVSEDIGGNESVDRNNPFITTEASPQLPPPGSVSKLARNTTLIDLKKLKTESDHNTPFLIDQVTVMVDESDNVKVMDYGLDDPSMDSGDSTFFASRKHCKVEIDAADMIDSDGVTATTIIDDNTTTSSTLSATDIINNFRANKHRRLNNKKNRRRMLQLSSSGNSGNNSKFFSDSENNNLKHRINTKTVSYKEEMTPVDPYHDYLYEANSEPSHEQFQNSNIAVSLQQMRRLRVDCNVALVDIGKVNVVYAHRVVLVSRSPYFYRVIYLRRKRLNFLNKFSRFTLPQHTDFEAVEAVVQYMYSGSISPLYGCSQGVPCVIKVLRLFEMHEAVELIIGQSSNYGDVSPQPIRQRHSRPHTSSSGLSSNIKSEPRDHSDDDQLHLMMMDQPHCVEETTTVIDDKRKRRRLTTSGTGGISNQLNSSGDGSYSGEYSSRGNPGAVATGYISTASPEEIRLKSCVQKLVDSALTPFLSKLEELFDPHSSTMQVARSSQHVITLWNADLLLTKLFDQNELTKYFTDYMNELMEMSSYQTEDVTSDVGSYTVDTLITVPGTSLDEAYIATGSTDSNVPDVETLTVGDMQIINYTQMEPTHIPKYARMISLYKFRVMLGGNEDSSSAVENALKIDGENNLDARSEQLTRLCIKHVSQDLSKRSINDLDTKLNGNYQEEMIMHIIVEQMETDKILPLCIGLFLAKGCSFCRKRECKSEDLTAPICPDNPICPDRSCIKRNLVCHICNKQMANSKSLTRHKYSVHDLQSGETAGLYICSHCGETFSKKWKLNVHEKQHEDRKLQVSCPICHKVMRGAIALKKHINMVHETKRQYMCEHCHKMFKRKETLYVHRRIHTGEKPFVCSHCDYSSETKGNLKAHTWRKHKRPLLATSVGNNGIETSITGPVSSVEDMESLQDSSPNGRQARGGHLQRSNSSNSEDMMLEGHQLHEERSVGSRGPSHSRGSGRGHLVSSEMEEDESGHYHEIIEEEQEDDDGTTVLEGPVLELEEELVVEDDDHHHAGDDQYQQATFILP